MSLELCRIIELPKITDGRGDLTVIEKQNHVPFTVQRVFYTYNLPPTVRRGEHAHRSLEEVLICLSGSFDAYLDDGSNKTVYHLNSPVQGLYIPPLIWSTQTNFSPGTVCLVLASLHYDEHDYFRNYNDYLRYLKAQKCSSMRFTSDLEIS